MTDHIHDFWESQAEQHGTEHLASWGDGHAIQLEIEVIAQEIRPGDRVLDVGCANGYSAVRQLETGLQELVGVDFSQQMIAQTQFIDLTDQERAKVHFEVGDVRDLRFEDDLFDVVYTTRVLINLPTWEEQGQGIRECLRVARPGGKVILLEAFWEPLVRLNAIRLLASLPPLVEHDFNRYLKMERLESYLRGLGVDFRNVDFSSVYYLGSRFLRELVTEVDAYPGYTNPVNRDFYELERKYSGGSFGVQQAYILTKPS